MTRSAVNRWRLGAAALALAALAGCAGKGLGTPSAGTDIATQSDETEANRRARIRLELAANYFQSGKTTIALDEVKQALILDPNNADAYNLRGLIYMRLGENELTDDSFQRASALRPRDSDVAHNYGWFLCQQKRYAESEQQFNRALAQPGYQSRDKTYMAQGLCQEAAGQPAQAEQTLIKAYELNPGNPVVGYNLAVLMQRRGELQRAQFYIRRLNSSDLANAQSLWLGIKIERGLGNRRAMQELVVQLRQRFPESSEFAAYERGNFNE